MKYHCKILHTNRSVTANQITSIWSRAESRIKDKESKASDSRHKWERGLKTVHKTAFEIRCSYLVIFAVCYVTFTTASFHFKSQSVAWKQSGRAPFRAPRFLNNIHICCHKVNSRVARLKIRYITISIYRPKSSLTDKNKSKWIYWKQCIRKCKWQFE